MSGTVPVLTDEAWLERAERRARRCVRNPAAYPCLSAKFVAALVAEMDRLRALGVADDNR